MVLDARQISDILKKRKNSDIVQLAVRNEERLRFHCTTLRNGNSVFGTLERFKDYVKGILQSEEKFDLFLTFLRFPIATNSLAENIFAELNKVFYGQNFVNTVSFADSEAKEDWDVYVKRLKLHEDFENKALEAMSNMINSIIVVDLPKEQMGSRPEPYFYFLDIANVVCFDVRSGSDELEYIMFWDCNDNLAVFDDEMYRVYECERRDSFEDMKLVLESRHGLGYVPAAFFWRDYMYADGKCVKKSPIAKDLDKMDYLLFKIISQRIAMLGSEYPVTYSFEADDDCDYHTADGLHCKDGYIVDSLDQYVSGTDGGVMPCPICSKKGYRGAGTHVTVPVFEEGKMDVGKPIGMMVTPTDTLRSIDDSIEKLKSEIFNDVVGKDGFFSENSMSDTQIHSNFESRKTVLMKLKPNFEEAEKFIIDTVCGLRYEEGRYLGCSVDYGTEFYLYNVEELRDRYKKAKDAGASESELSYIDDQIICTELRNNPEQLRRILLLRQIEPYRNSTIGELRNIMSSGAVDQELFAIKLNFPSLIDRFERENCNILDFGNGMRPDAKVNAIIETLKTYIKISNNYGKENNEQSDGGRGIGFAVGGENEQGRV